MLSIRPASFMSSAAAVWPTPMMPAFLNARLMRSPKVSSASADMSVHRNRWALAARLALGPSAACLGAFGLGQGVFGFGRQSFRHLRIEGRPDEGDLLFGNARLARSLKGAHDAIAPRLLKSIGVDLLRGG